MQEGSRHLAEMMARCSTLQSLSLVGNAMGDAGAKAIAAVLLPGRQSAGKKR